METIKNSRYVNELDSVTQDVILLLSETMDVNSIFLISNDAYSNTVIKAFNRDDLLIHEGYNVVLKDKLSEFFSTNNSEVVEINNLEELNSNHPLKNIFHTGCFMGAPIYQANSEIFGMICMYDTKPYQFSNYDIRLVKTLTSLLSQTIKLEDLTLHDHLTGLHNSRYLKTFFEQKRESDKEYSLLYVDLDHFKHVNDNFGHDVGDELLKKIASLFKKIIPTNSVVTRIGGDEFVFLIPVTSKEMIESREVALQIIDALTTHPIEVEGQGLTISASVGMTYIEPGKSLKMLMKEADNAMYQAKRSGRNNLSVH